MLTGARGLSPEDRGAAVAVKGTRIRDPFGHQWGIGRHVEDVSEEEMARRMAAFYGAGDG